MKLRNNIKPFVCGFIACLILSSTVANAATISKTIKVFFGKPKIYVDGIERKPTSEPFTYNNTIYVPVKFISEALGKKYTYDSKNNKVYIGSVVQKVNKEVTLTDKDSKYKLSFPAGWNENNGNQVPGATLIASDANESAFTACICENKNSFSEGTTLDDYIGLVTKMMSNNLGNAVISEAKSKTINGLSAQEFEVQGEVSKLKLSYIVTIIETPDYFFKISSWTTQSQIDKKRSELIKINNSFTLIK